MAAGKVALGLGSGTLLAAVGAAVWFDSTHLSMSECRAIEAKQYPQLEQTAAEVAGPMGDLVSRVGSCDDTGEPGATVRVSVYEWTARQEARAFLRQHDLALVEDRAVMAGGTRVGYVSVVDYLENDGEQFVELSFSVPE
ncbi:MAG: hypothetical protein WA966_04645 [Ornithinimicrobium sp.]